MPDDYAVCLKSAHGSRHCKCNSHTHQMLKACATSPLPQIFERLRALAAIGYVKGGGQLGRDAGAAVRACVLGALPLFDSHEASAVAWEDATLTHYHPNGRNTAVAVVRLCRRLCQGEGLESAVRSLSRRYISQPEVMYALLGGLQARGAPASTDATATLQTAIHVVSQSHSFSEASKHMASGSLTSECSSLVGAMAGALFGIEQVAAAAQSCDIHDVTYIALLNTAWEIAMAVGRSTLTDNCQKRKVPCLKREREEEGPRYREKESCQEHQKRRRRKWKGTEKEAQWGEEEETQKHDMWDRCSSFDNGCDIAAHNAVEVWHRRQGDWAHSGVVTTSKCVQHVALEDL